MRKLVTVRTIDNILPIQNADAIEQLVIGGWNVVAQKGIHSVGDLVVYFEIDSFLPIEDVRFESFMKFGVNTFEGKQGHRVKTKRLRGVYSQGVVIPLVEFPEIPIVDFEADYAEQVGVVKYEKQEVTGYSGDTKGSFPWFLQKSDQDRIQNVYNRLTNMDVVDKEFVGTLKMDGSSITVFAVDKNKYAPDSDDVIGVDIAIGYCSRNQQLKMPETSEDGWFENTGKFYQGNFEKFEKYQVFAYNIYDVDAVRFVDYKTFLEYAALVDLQIVPEVYPAQKILEKDVGEIVQMADGKGLLANYREGVVWKQVDGDCQFKAISNKYLDKEV